MRAKEPLIRPFARMIEHYGREPMNTFAKTDQPHTGTKKKTAAPIAVEMPISVPEPPMLSAVNPNISVAWLCWCSQRIEPASRALNVVVLER
jgi:hypothetical protein